MLRKISGIILVIAAVTLLMPVAFAAESTVASVRFGENPITSDLTVSRKGTAEKFTGERNGVQGWRINTSRTESDAIYIDLSNSYVSGNNDGSYFEIEVEYYDEKNGYFTIYYDSYDGNKFAETVYCTGKNAFASHTFCIPDAYFKDRLDNAYDFKITSNWEKGKSGDEILVKSLNVRKYPNKASLNINYTTRNTGNIFSDNEKIVFKTEYNNRINSNYSFGVLYEVISGADNSVLWSENKSLSISAKGSINDSVTISDIPNGMYTLRITTQGVNGLELTYEIPFAKVMSGKRNDRFLFNVHFGAYYRDLPDTAADTLELIKKANAGGYRDHPAGWSEIEYVKGTFSSPQFLRALEKMPEFFDFPSSVNTLAFGHKDYTGGTHFTPPTGTEVLKHWGEFNRQLLDRTKVRRVEVWNEPNWGNYVDPSTYIDMVSASIDGINDDNVKIGVGSLASPFEDSALGSAKLGGKDYLNLLIDEGILDLDIDALTMHFYTTDVDTVREQVLYYRNLLDTHGRSDMEIWVTEYGYPTSIGGISEKAQARAEVKQYLILNAENLVSTMAHYEFINDETSLLADNEQSLGALHNYYQKFSENKVAFGAKEVYVQLAAMNALMADVSSGDGSEQYGKNLSVCGFNTSDNEKIIAMWSKSDANVELVTDANEITMYDCYGNAVAMASDNGRYNIKCASDVLYIKGKIGEYNICTGGKDAPYVLKTAEDLISFRNMVNSGQSDICAQLANDITFPSGSIWTPIGSYQNNSTDVVYSGVFDGNGYSINNIQINGGWDRGLFGNTSGATVKNLTLRGNISGGAHVAGFVAYATGATDIENCANYVNVTADDQRASAFIGWADEICTVRNCYNAGNISGADTVTGIAHGSNLENCYNMGNVTALSGRAYAGTVRKSTSDNVTVSNTYSLENTVKGKVSSVYNVTLVTNAQLSSGEMAFNLGNAFGQRIGEDNHPVLKKGNNSVYKLMGQNIYDNPDEPGNLIELESDIVKVFANEDIPTASLCIAQYDGDVLVDVVNVNVGINAKNYIQEKLSINKNTDKIKGFLFTDKLAPICKYGYKAIN